MSLLTVNLSLLNQTDWPVMAGAVVVALGVDFWLGEPRARWHPVVWMGHYLNAAGQFMAPKVIPKVATQASRPVNEFCRGMLGWSLGALPVLVLAAVASGLVLKLTQQLPWLQMLLLGVLLKLMLAWRMLRDEVLAVEQALAESLDSGRKRVSRLVSRDVSTLNATQVREAALSTLAENLNDSVLAPLFWFAVAGLPGAALYRFANTADAMWGYPGERQERQWAWAGKWTARVDDVLSWIPARLTAVLLGLPTLWRGMSKVMHNAGLTPSPNGGWPMGALAFRLGIRLGKTGVYQLNPQGRASQPADTDMALRACGQVVALLAGGATWVVIMAMVGGALGSPFAWTSWGV
jgi:adenosylcobinamide-phosphate synthase